MTKPVQTKRRKEEVMATSADGTFVQPAIPNFDGHDDHWSMLMENFLWSKEYWSLVEEGIPEQEYGDEVTPAQKKATD